MNSTTSPGTAATSGIPPGPPVLNALSLCSGIGGLDLGLESTGGIRVRGQVEIDPWCRGILAAHWPDVPLHDDIRTCAEWWNSAPRPRIDLVCGGIPCQPHSQAGKQLGTADPRWLWPAARDVIEAVQAPLVLIENVPRLVRTGLITILADLAGLGFDAWWDRVPAAAFGAPHLRWRLILIAAHPGRVTLAREPFTGPAREHAGYDGATWSVADPECNGRPGGTEETPGETDEPGQGPRAETPGCGPGRGTGGVALRTVAYPFSPGLEDRRVQPGVDGTQLPAAVRAGDRRETGTRQPGLGRGSDGPASWLDGSWEDGIPRTCPAGYDPAERTARLKAIGNAVVPAVAGYAGRVLLSCLDGG